MPSHNQTLDTISLSVFEPLVARLKRARGKVIPLHQGKTAVTTPVELRAWAAGEFDYPPHHDGPTSGVGSLIEAVCEKLSSQLGVVIDPLRIQITNGITHALSVIFHSILQRGDEVLVLSPHWLFVNGLIAAAGGVPVEVPFFSVGPRTAPGALVDGVRPFVTSRTRAIYFNTPNNPTGYRLTRRQLEELVQLARSSDCWLVSDNAYEYYDYTGENFIDPVVLADASENTFSAYSFSKSFGLTGYRIGYLLSPMRLAQVARKFSLYSIYSVPTISQFVALFALRAPLALREEHRAFIREAMQITARNLRVPATVPEGGFYTLLDLADWPLGTDDFINRCVDAGVSLAPGAAFGAHYERHARLCYSVVKHEDLREGIEIINEVFARGA